MDGMLSQEEINALLNGIDSENSSSDTDTSAGNASGSNAIDEALTPMELKHKPVDQNRNQGLDKCPDNSKV